MLQTRLHNPGRDLLLDALSQRILVTDGAMGTSILAQNLKAEDYGGREFEGCNENLVFTRPDLIEKIHEEYLQAGCDILETNTFGGLPSLLGRYGLRDQAYQQNLQAAQLAKKVAE